MQSSRCPRGVSLFHLEVSLCLHDLSLGRHELLVYLAVLLQAQVSLGDGQG